MGSELIAASTSDSNSVPTRLKKCSKDRLSLNLLLGIAFNFSWSNAMSTRPLGSRTIRKPFDLIRSAARDKAAQKTSRVSLPGSGNFRLLKFALVGVVLGLDTIPTPVSSITFHVPMLRAEYD